MERSETKTRSLVKGLTWRILSFVGTTFILFVTGDTTFESLTRAFIISLGAVLLFFIHERLWLRVRWGVKAVAKPPLPSSCPSEQKT